MNAYLVEIVQQQFRRIKGKVPVRDLLTEACDMTVARLRPSDNIILYRSARHVKQRGSASFPECGELGAKNNGQCMLWRQSDNDNGKY